VLPSLALALFWNICSPLLFSEIWYTVVHIHIKQWVSLFVFIFQSSIFLETDRQVKISFSKKRNKVNLFGLAQNIKLYFHIYVNYFLIKAQCYLNMFPPENSLLKVATCMIYYKNTVVEDFCKTGIHSKPHGTHLLPVSTIS
jgi:hypothetical protein